jgi:hypothetical protein
MSSPTHAVAAPEAPAKSAAPFAVSPARMQRLQRACACGGQCDSCKKKPEPKPVLQRKAVPGAPSPQAAAPRAPAAPKAPAPPPAQAKVAPQPAPAIAAAPGAATKAPAPPKAPAAPKTPAPPKAAAPQAPDPAAVAKDHAKSAPGKDAPKSATPAITEKKKAGDANADLPPIVRRVLDTPGEPLDFATRTAMEGRFGHSFQDVRVHTDSLAAESARAVYAHAYTVGEHIVFDHGQYRPETPIGQHLLAHELAHTIQQHGLQKSAAVSSDMSGDYHHLEHEAEAAARTVMERPPVAGAHVSPSRAAQPRLSRASSAQPSGSASQTANQEDEASWIPLDKSKYPLLDKAGVGAISRLKSDPDLVAVQMAAPFVVPAEKGPSAQPLWDAQAKAGVLEAIMAPGASEPKTKVALKQERPDTDDLRDLWALKVGWPEGSEKRLWKAAAKKAGIPSAEKSTFRPSTKAGTRSCDVDHILELQFGGNNVAQNMQMLDRSPNRSSGGQISHFLRSTATGIRKALQTKDPTSPRDRTKTTAIRMQFSSAKVSDETLKDCRCCQIEAFAKDPDVLKDAPKAEDKAGPLYPMRFGAFNQCVVADDDSDVDLLHSKIPENKAASTLVRGLLLNTWTLPKNKSGMKPCPAPEEKKADTPDEDTSAPAKGKATKGKAAQKGPSQAGGKVTAKIDPNSRILKRLTAKEDKAPLELLRDADGNLAAPSKTSRVGFFLNGLSEGYFTRLDVDAEGNLTGAGQVIPSATFLPNPIDVEFDKDRFVMSTQVKKPKLPIPGVEITESSIGLQIAPEFKPEGKVGFRVAPGGKEILHGLLTVSADANGLAVDGEVYATIPGTDEVKGTLTLRNKEWSGGIDIKAGGNGKIKYVKSVDVAIRFAQQQGMSATGTAVLAIPGVAEPVTASVHYDRDGWALRAKARFNPPRIKPVDIELEYANGHLSGEGRTGFEFNTLHGEIHVIYRDEMFSGDAELGIKTDRAEGSLKVEMHHRPNGAIYFTGEGHVSFKVTNDLVASAGVIIDEQEKVKVTGELAFNKPIQLFKGFSGHYTFFDIEEDIPLPPPLSIGGIGLNVNIEGSLSAGYSVGPVMLEDVKATAEFQPLEKDPDVQLDLTSKLVIGATASISGTIKGGIKLSVVVASIRGDLGITATATLKGGMNVPFHAHYGNGKITADVGFEANLALILSLALIASVEAKAGIGWLSVTTGKEWTLGSFTYDPGLSLGMSLKKPIHYESPANFTLPSVDDIAWVKPTLDPKNLVSSTAGATPDSKEHDV